MPEASFAGTEVGVGIPYLTSALSLEGLTQLTADGRVLPRLAEGWSWEQGGLRLRLNLRPGVTFHDGTPMTASLMADVVKAELSRPRSRALYPSFADVSSVRATGDLQLIFELTQPSAFLLDALEVPLGIKSQSIGTGPYRVIKSSESAAELQAFETYHSGSPQIQDVVVRPFPTLRTAWTSLLRDEIDMVMNVPADAVEFVQNDNVQIVSVALPFQFLIAFNSSTHPFKSPIVRRALNIAVNREELIRKVFEDHASASTGPLWPRHWAYDKSIPAYSYDPATARSLLDAADFRSDTITGSGQSPARFRFTCLVPAGLTLLERVALEVQRQLYNVGVDITFEVVPINDFDTRVRQQRFQAMLISMISGPTIERADMFWRSGKTFKGLNVFGYENPEAERLFALLRASTNEAAIRSATSGLQRVLMDDPPALFLAWNQVSRAIRRDFSIIAREGTDPIDTIWQWTPAANVRLSAAR